MRHFSFAAVGFLGFRFQRKAFKVLNHFFIDFRKCCDFKFKFFRTMSQILQIQTKIKTQIVTRYAKVDILCNYWDKMIGQIQLNASKLKDAKTSEICRKIMIIPKRIQFVILRYYVAACRNIYAVAFFQWRQLYPSQFTCEEELTEILE